MFCMRLFGGCWGVGAQQRALLEAHYGPASAEADAEAPAADDFGDWNDDAAADDDDRHRDAAPAPTHTPPTMLVRSAAPSPPAAASAAAAPAVLELSGGRPVAAPRPVRPVVAPPAEALAEKEEDFFADMAPTVKQAPVVPPSRAAPGPSRLALSVRPRPSACAPRSSRVLGTRSGEGTWVWWLG